MAMKQDKIFTMQLWDDVPEETLWIYSLDICNMPWYKI